MDSMEGAGEELRTRRGLHASECSSGCRPCYALLGALKQWQEGARVRQRKEGRERLVKSKRGGTEL